MSFFFYEQVSENLYRSTFMSGNTYSHCWFYNEELTIPHRLDGPAVIHSELELPGTTGDTIRREWWYMGEQVNCSSQEEFEKFLKLKTFW